MIGMIDNIREMNIAEMYEQRAKLKPRVVRRTEFTWLRGKLWRMRYLLSTFLRGAS